jgi:hypothetical protein
MTSSCDLRIVSSWSTTEKEPDFLELVRQGNLEQMKRSADHVTADVIGEALAETKAFTPTEETLIGLVSDENRAQVLWTFFIRCQELPSDKVDHIVNRLLIDAKFDMEIWKNAILRICMAAQQTALLEMLIFLRSNASILQSLIEWAFANILSNYSFFDGLTPYHRDGLTRTLQILLSFQDEETQIHSRGKALEAAAKFGLLDPELNTLLDSGPIPEENIEHAKALASANGHLDIVSALDKKHAESLHGYAAF